VGHKASKTVFRVWVYHKTRFLNSIFTNGLETRIYTGDAFPSDKENAMSTETQSNAHLLTETVCSLSEVPKLIPNRPNFSTIWRWTRKGIRGEVLETYRIGGRVVTSHQAVHRFLEATQKR
jgi:hypothetical protein